MTDDTTETAVEAKEDWDRRIFLRLTDTAAADPSTDLPAPTSVRAVPGGGHVRLDWAPVEGAAGYVIERTDGAAGQAHIVRHGGSDVAAVAGTAFADTNLDDALTYTYRIGTVTGADHPAWNWSEPVSAHTSRAAAGTVAVAVDAATSTGQLQRVWRMLGSERLTQLRFGDDGNGHNIGAEFAAALRQAHDDLGLRRLRAHAILHDDNEVVTRSDDGSLAYDFAIVDELYDQVLAAGIRPVVEVSFMPAVLARDPEETVFAYRGIISPPRDWDEWGEVNGALAGHLVDRYGIDEVSGWGFEIWNEPNLQVFWTGTQAEYLRLYDVAARAIKGIDDRLLVGGPSTSAGEWIDAFTAYAEEEKLPLDFVTSHTYGNVPLANGPELAAHGFDGVPIWWTEWGVGSTHFGPIHDSVLGAPFVLNGLLSVQGRMDALAYWVVSDHFEELGRPPRLFHNGFGLLSVGNLRKPRYWAVHLAEHLGDAVIASRAEGDGAEVLVQTWATRHDDGTVDVLVWNGTINGELVHGDERLDRRVELSIGGLEAARYGVELARVDEQHSNIVRWLPDDVEWPNEVQQADLRRHDELHTEAVADVEADGGVAGLAFELPMPSVVRVRMTPTGAGR